MVITRENINSIDIQSVQKDQEKIIALLQDLELINSFTKNKYSINVQEYHNEYSPERCEPCPDYYGYFTLVYKDGDHYEVIGDVMDIDTLDDTLFVLYTFVVETNEFTDD